MTRSIAVATLAGVLLLSGCAAQPAATRDLTLLDTKSPVQLMRNEAADRLDPAVFDKVRKSSDASFPCVTEDGNAGGLVRQWKSSTDLALVEGADERAAAKHIVDSLVDQGWDVEESAEQSSVDLTVLSNPGSLALIEVAAADESKSSLVRVTATGPCVMTDGPDSAEVRNLG